MTSKEEPLVSVVTPVYNGERDLRECIESVLAQTYQNWEYTILNNCSTDRSLEIAHEYAAQDPRIRVHSNREFAPVIRNHNLALRLISPHSKYCKLLFADDWLFPECLEKMVGIAEAHPTVGIVGAFALRGDKVEWDGLPYWVTFYSGYEICRLRLFDGPYVFGSGTSLLYRADLVRGRESFYNEANLHADTEVCFDLLQHCDFGFVHQVLTFTRIEEGTLRSFSRRFNTYLPGFLYDLVTYGPAYLTRAELDGRVKVHLWRYYKFLAESALRPMGTEFWKYHRNKLKESGHPLRWSRLLRAVLVKLFDAALNPKRSIQSLLYNFSRAQTPPNIQQNSVCKGKVFEATPDALPHWPHPRDATDSTPTKHRPRSVSS